MSGKVRLCGLRRRIGCGGYVRRPREEAVARIGRGTKMPHAASGQFGLGCVALPGSDLFHADYYSLPRGGHAVHHAGCAH